jgi:hypothetical protein
MVENGFNEGQIWLSESRRTMSYAGWELGGIDGYGKLYIIPFKTNREVYLEPADPAFFEKLHDALVFPKPGEEWGTFWHGPAHYVSDLPIKFI